LGDLSQGKISTHVSDTSYAVRYEQWKETVGLVLAKRVDMHIPKTGNQEFTGPIHHDVIGLSPHT
jgi:hypothetical protein